MRITPDEMTAILDDAIAALGTALALHIQQLNEVSAGRYANTLKKRIDDLKARLEKARAAEDRKKELERDNADRNASAPAEQKKCPVDEARTAQVPTRVLPRTRWATARRNSRSSALVR